MVEFQIGANDSGQRIDRFITKAMPELPKSMMYRLIRKKDIKLNGRRCEISDRLSEGDVVRVYVKESVSAERRADMSFLSVPAEIQIVYEDENILVVNKPVGIDSHPGSSFSGDTLIDRIKHYLYNKKEYVPEGENAFAPALCSRLDRNTSGLVTAAKTAPALREVNAAIRSGALHKIYRCVLTARPPHDEDVLTAYHHKDTAHNTVNISDVCIDSYKEIRTGYRVLAERRGLVLAEITLFTGRTHQIRAHMAHIGCPLLGDGKYGDISANKRNGVFRQALCAYALDFELPSDSPLAYLNDVVIKAPTPEFERKLFS